LAGNPNVAFRFVFKSDVSVVGPGVALDDFEIIGPANSVGLPVVASPLRGDWQGEAVRLEWDTYSETRNEGFWIERSYDGAQFRTLGFVPSQQGIQPGAQYHFVDEQPGGDRLWYRYRQMDTDGAEQLSNIVNLSRSSHQPMEALVYPNPAPQAFQIWLTHMPEQDVKVEWMNLEGKLLQRNTHHFPVFTGQLSMDFSQQPMPAGTYLLRIHSGGQVLTRKVNIIQ
jgi:hypothetical protein